ncbi:MAG TPA: hypothetical protein VFA20_26165 [Myxococcaceae bacterium]|nr:hypothetical protein [Myxococcaceae bacterium]
MPARPTALLALSVLTACAAQAPLAKPPPTPGPAPAPAGEVAHGRGYTVPVPAGFFEVKEGAPPQIMSLRNAGGIVLAEKVRPAFEDGFLGSFVVTPIIPFTIDPADAATCELLSNTTMQQIANDLDSAKIITLKIGKTCQWVSHSHAEPHRGATGTVMPGPDAWMLVCSYDLRDPPAQAGCQQVVEGWTFDAAKP